MTRILNTELYEVVRRLYDQAVAEFSDQDLHSEKFLSSFPYAFVGYDHGDEEARQEIIEAALLPQLRHEAQKAIEACYANSFGGDPEFYVRLAVDDFLNYIIPRTVGLTNGDEIFDRYYCELDSSLYGSSCLVTINAIVRDLYDNHGSSDFCRLDFALYGLSTDLFH